MALESRNHLFEVIGRDPHELIGEPETSWLDFKTAPYAIGSANANHEHERFELAKDVTALGNAKGGVILIGVETERDANIQEDVAARLRPVSKGNLNAQQMKEVIRDWTYPLLEVEIRPHDVPGESGQLWSVSVDRHQESEFPFFVTKGFVGEGGPDRRQFAVLKRVGTDNVAVSPQQVHGWTNVGNRRQEEVPGMTPKPALEDADSVLSSDLRAIGSQPGWASYYLQAVPVGADRLSRFHQGASDSLYDALVQPRHHLRAMGFNLPDGEAPERTANGSLRLTWVQNDSISVTPAGLATAIEGQDHLTWGYENFAISGERWINSIAIVEFTLDFWRFYAQEVLSRIDETVSTSWRAGLRGLQEPERLYLPSQAVKRGPRILSPRDRHDAPRDSFDSDWSSTTELEPPRLAFECLSNVFGYFGFDEAVIPYSGDGAVDEEAILAVR